MTYHYPQPLQPLNPARPLPQGLTWFALISKAAREFKAAHWLEETYGNCMTLIPLETRYRTKGHRGGVLKYSKAQYQVALMPRIIFAGFPSPPNWLSIWDGDEIFSGILGAIGTNGTPLSMRHSEVERFRSNLDHDRANAGLPVLQIGGRAMFVGDGVFNGHILDIEGLDEKSAVVAQDWFGAKRSVKVSRDDLEPLDNPVALSKIRI
jgi:hypothetical protein